MASSVASSSSDCGGQATAPLVHKRHAQRKPTEFSTRFLPSDNIPSYNALLDSHLGKRREFLLGNKQSLQHLQRTGAIARVEEMAENPSQYVVIVAEKKPPLPGSTSSSTASGKATSSSLYHDLYGSSHQHRANERQFVARKSFTKSESTPTLASSPDRTHRRRQPTQDDREEVASSSVGEEQDQGNGTELLPSRLAQLAVLGSRPSMGTLGRSASMAALHGKPMLAASGQSSESKTETLVNHLRRRRSSQGDMDRRLVQCETAFVAARNSLAPRHASPLQRPAIAGALQTSLPSSSSSSSSPSVTRTPVEKLLESDASYQLQLQILRDEMRLLEHEKRYIDNHIATMRKKLRGVNAVHENDVAVAHCSAIMHARIAKAEEEFMKRVTAQQQVKTDIDTLRRELLAMRKVLRKLENDIVGVENANAVVDDRVRASKGVRNVLSQELVEQERRAELALEEQRLKLPPEQDIVVDAHELVSVGQLQGHMTDGSISVSVSRCPRRSTVVLTAGSPLENLQRMLSDKTIVAEVVAADKPLLSFRSAFCVMQQMLGIPTHDNVDEFVRHFEETENALLSKHKCNSQLQDEVAQLEKEAAALKQDAVMRHATIRGTLHVATTVQQQLQQQIQATLHKIDAYDELRDVRNHEHTRLRAIMQRCLEVLHAEKLVSSQESPTGPLLLSELTSPAMLEALQKKMTEVAITLKMKHHHHQLAHDSPVKTATAQSHSDNEEDKEEELVAIERHGGRVRSATSTKRRSNVLAKRETPASTILLGPRGPSGAALASIRISAQPPTVEAAQALSEAHANEMRALHPRVMGPILAAAAAASAKSQRRLAISRGSSIRAGKRASTVLNAGSNRRISAPATIESSATGGRASGLVDQARPSSRASVVWPLRKTDTSDSLIQAEDAHARVIEDADELDE